MRDVIGEGLDLALHVEDEYRSKRGIFENMTTQLVEPISINTVNKLQEAIGALEDYHNDTLGIDEWGDGPDCQNCEMCQAVKVMKQVINSIYTTVGLEPLYDVK